MPGGFTEATSFTQLIAKATGLCATGDPTRAVVEAGATAVIQPGGSVKDDEVIKAADDANLAMAFTSIRHFRH